MFKNTKRAERRHHYARMKNRLRSKGYWGHRRSDWSQKQLGFGANTRCICSTCMGCANPRKVTGDTTLAEQRAEEDHQHQLDDLD